MSALDRKLLRDVLLMKGQVIAICLVIGCGVATFVMSLSTLESLRNAKDRYYDRYRFGHVFGHLKRAPLSLVPRIEAIPGVSRTQARVVMDVTLDVPGLPEPAVGRLISIPERRVATLNDLHLRSGRYIEPNRAEEVLVGEAFAIAHQFQPGDKVTAIINGRKKDLRIVGVVLSPEYVYSLRVGQLIPDDRRFGVFWMGEEALSYAFDMDGAFNDVSLALMPGAIEKDVISRLDTLTEQYGGLGAYGREDQISNRFLSDEIAQLQRMGIIVPAVFLFVAAFLLNVVLSRIISLQREQIAALKAFGYSNLAVGWHYQKLVLTVVVVGVLLGTGVGGWLGSNLTRMYTQFYHFPILDFQLPPRTVSLAFLISALAAMSGTLGVIRKAMQLPPAEAMRPEPPANYQPTVLERMGLTEWFTQPTRMILRNIERRPLKAFFSCFGMSLSLAILILGQFSADALDFLLNVQFFVNQRQDISVTFVEPTSYRALYEIEHLPGVMHVEPFRSVPVRLRFQHYERRGSIQGFPDNPQLNNLTDDQQRPISLPEDGLMLNTKLAELLGAGVGDLVTVEVLEGERPVRQVPVTGLATELLGTTAYMNINALNRILREGHSISGVYLTADERWHADLYSRLKQTPRVAGVTIKEAAVRSFQDIIVQNMLQMQMFNVIFACIIAFGVVYNTARIALSERGRELASLRVLGFTRGEISYILLGELALLALGAIPFGLLLGYGLARLTVSFLDTELYRIPLIIDPSTYGFAITIVVVAAFLSGLVVRRKLDHLDLVAVLKTRE